MGNDHRRHIEDLVFLITKLSDSYEYKLDEDFIRLISLLIAGLFTASKPARQVIYYGSLKCLEFLSEDLQRMVEERYKKSKDKLLKGIFN
jgi:hypothetical protein